MAFERRQHRFERAVEAIQKRTGLSRDEVIQEAAIFASRMEEDFLAQLCDRQRQGRFGGFLSKHGWEFLVVAMFLLGVLISAIQIMQRM